MNDRHPREATNAGTEPGLQPSSNGKHLSSHGRRVRCDIIPALSLYGLFQPSRIHAFASKAAKLSLVQTLATLLCAGCVDVTPPWDQVAPRSCLADSSTGCFHSPALNDIVDLSSAIPATSPKHVTKTFASFTDNTSWSANSAVQVVGLQWQFAGSSCAADVYITNVKFTKP
jgi:hypothetical protein